MSLRKSLLQFVVCPFEYKTGKGPVSPDQSPHWNWKSHLFVTWIITLGNMVGADSLLAPVLWKYLLSRDCAHVPKNLGS